MSQPMISVLSQQRRLSDAAFHRLQDTNEANLFVGKVISRALERIRLNQAGAVSTASLLTELDALIAASGVRRPS